MRSPISTICSISCFFTSHYEDIRDIDLTEFLMYFPNGEVPMELPEFEELISLENWPFTYVTDLDDMIVPIHRYKSLVVEDIFTEYSGISLEELTGVGFEGVFYLDTRLLNSITAHFSMEEVFFF